MKQVFLKGNQILVDEVPSPTVADNEVLVANAYSVISTGTEGTSVKDQLGSFYKLLQRPDLIVKVPSLIREDGIVKTWQEARALTKEQVPLGYNTAGIVLAVGRNVADINQGEKVACGGGQFAHHAEIVSVSRNLVAKIPSTVTLEEASFTTIGAVALHGIRRATIQFGETIVILGLGLLGLLAAQIARAGGYEVISFDTNDSRVALAKKLGIDNAFSLSKCDPVEETLALTDGFGADAVAIYAAAESSQVVNLAFDLCRAKAKVIVVGKIPMDLDRSKMYQKELELLISTAMGPGRFDPIYEEQSMDYPIGHVRWTENRNMKEFLALLAEGKVKVTPLISSVHPVEDAAQAYEKLSSLKAEPAVLLKYDSQKYTGEEKISSRISIHDTLPAITTGKIRTAIVGAGEFVQNFHLPNLKKLSDYYYLRAIVTAHGENSKSLADKYQADYASTDYHEVLKDDDVDLIIVGTRHNLHYPIIMDALKAGKKVFTEKPLCLRPEELEEISKAVSDTGIPVIVGFNRRYSSLARTLKQILAKFPAPYLIHYRVNVGAIAANHWTLDPQVGGGRIIGEACHFFDLFNFLLGKDNEVSNIQVGVIPINGKQVVARDNIIAGLTYSDGSLASLIYTTLGSRHMERERLEVFAENTSFVLNDYHWLESHGFSLNELNIQNGRIRKNRLELPEQDKGWEQELIELAKFLKGEASEIISFGEVMKATELTFTVEELSRAQPR
jgi:predicted dehydrogenase/threonine dehydrogenase-like Zn-dependent dehydrogenase